MNIINEDYELKLADLKNLKVSWLDNKLFAQFDNIYVDNFDFLFKINLITLEGLYTFALNGFYENYKDVYKLHKITISQEVAEYLKDINIKHFEEGIK